MARFLGWSYRRLGGSYPAVFVTLELQTAIVVTAATALLLSFYYDGTTEQLFQLTAIAVGLTFVTVWIALARIYPRLAPLRRWIDGERDLESTAAAWSTAVALPLELIRRDLVLPVVTVVVPACIASTAILGLSWLAFFPFAAASLVALGYAMILHYLAMEIGLRPVLIDINRVLAPRLAPDRSALPLRVRLMAALPLINLITGLVVAAITSPGGGGSNLGVDVLVALAVATTISLELSVMLSKSILLPIADLQSATEAVREGRLDEAAVPVTTGDEIGELAASFNQMLDGLRERERLRDAFGTYLDREVAEYILSEGFTEEGVEVDVSILFCDVRDFTSFAARASAREVVARLNELFEVVVPIIARHGGHVDKFEGDGVMAVFGAPEGFPDHADRAVRAACEIARTVNGRGAPGPDGAAGAASEGAGSDGVGRPGRFEVGVGVNTGRVVAGAIGGAGRLNYSVVGDAVNVASRVEAATRETGDDVLITEATMGELSPTIGFEARGTVRLRGLERPVALYAPHAEPEPEPNAERVETISPNPRSG